MLRTLSLLALSCAAAACARPGNAERTAVQSDAANDAAMPAQPPAARASTHLTVYSGDYEQLTTTGDGGQGAPGFVLVDRELRYTLEPGRNRIVATHMPRAMDAEAVTLKPLSDGVGVLSQRYIAPPADSGDVLAAAVGRKVSVEHTAGGSKQTDAGTLVSAAGGLTLALADGQVKVIREYDNFSIVDADALVPQQAALQWTVQADKALDARFALSYPTGGMAWRAEYQATLAPGPGCSLELDGAALVANRSGTTYDARLTLVAGSPNRSEPEDGMALDRIQVTGSRLANAQARAAAPVVRTSGEYHAYELPGAYQVANGSTERVPLFERLAGVACERAYETAPEMDMWEPPRPLVDPGYNHQTGPQPVKTTLSLKNDKAAGLDRPLPAGRVRVFEGRDFLGESMLTHTPKGADIRLEVGTVFDLSAERERSAFRVDRAGRTMTESFAITLRNAKPTDATVRVVEPVPRWSSWEIVASSVPAKKRDARRAEFEVTVPAGGETRLTYTARYRWAPGIRP